MYKWMYDRMVEEYSKETREELVQRIMAGNEIELEDRSFANQCCAGVEICNINALFSALEELQNDFSGRRYNTILNLIDKAKTSWNFITNGLTEMSQDTRIEEKSVDIKRRVSMAENAMDII